MTTRSVGAIEFTLNGKAIAVPANEAERPLLWVLRDRLALRGTKFGCGRGGCGACTVDVDGEAVTSCDLPAKDVAGKRVTTIEGLAERTDHPVVRAWLAEQVPQCGYCQPAMVVSAAALLARTPKPTPEQIDEALSPVLCRCGTYPRVRRAVERAAAERWDDAPFGIEALPPAPRAPTAPPFRFNPWVSVAADGTVTVTVGRSEMGQGVTTALAMMVAEELEVPLEEIRTEAAPVDSAYDNPVIGMQVTVGSLSMQTTWGPVRRAAADARERLLSAAAAAWHAERSDCAAGNGEIVHHPSGRAAGYGAFAQAAAALPPVADPPLKAMEAFRVLGRPTARLELPGHVAGRTVFGMDVRLPGMLYATIVLPPRFGAKPLAIDAAQAKATVGVRGVVRVLDGVAVVADDLWAAFRGREVLGVTWDESQASHLSSAEISQRFRAASERSGEIERERGGVEAALGIAKTVFKAEYETPYLAHAAIEPMNCTARVAFGRCDVWVPTQGQTMARAAAARAAELPLESVAIHTTFLGGGFGRRSAPDVVAQTVELAKKIGSPVQFVWTRDEDMRHDRYRPANFTKLRCALDGDGRVSAWFERIVGPPLALGDIDVPYEIPNLRVEIVEDDPGVPTWYWRSVGASQNAFAVEGTIDELAYAAHADPVAFRLQHLAPDSRHRGVLKLAAEKAGWGTPLAAGRARGAAVAYAHGGWAAQIAEISIAEDRTIVVHRVVCAVDCGFPINPDTVAAQVEGAIAFGMTAALKASITIDDGHAVERSFHDYPLLTLREMPQVEVHVVPSREPPTGAGECGVPPVAPAIANAVFAATGERLRRLPLRL